MRRVCTMPGKASMLMWIILCDILQTSLGEELARCSSVPISPQTGLCEGFVFQTKICTGDSSLFTSNFSALVNKNQKQTKILESYTLESYCWNDVRAKCKSYLPSTSVWTSYLLLCMHPCCINEFGFFIR